MISQTVSKASAVAIMACAVWGADVDAAWAEEVFLPPATVSQSANDKDITKEDMENFVDLMFSERNVGVFLPRDGKVHKWIGHIKIHVFWPRCEGEIGTYVNDLKEYSNIDLSYESGPDSDGSVQILIIVVNNGMEIINNKNMYDWIITHTYKNEENMKNMLDELDNKGLMGIYQTYSNDVDRKILFMQNILRDDWVNVHACGVVKSVIFDNIANRRFVKVDEHFGLLEDLYISALYDRSVLVGEDISTAKPKIVNAMIETLERNK